MPRRKKTLSAKKPVSEVKVIDHPTPRQGITAYARNSYRWAESYTSLLMGVVVIIIAVLFVVSLIRATHHMQDTSSVATGPVPTTTIANTTPTQQPSKDRTYIVQSGDDLWHIAERVYGNGDNWEEIAQANNLSDPGIIFAGDKLTLPLISQRQTQPQPTSGQVSQTITREDNRAITGNSYTVVHGDTLWDIAVRAYADGYKWTELAEVNNLSQPDLIFSGNVLKIPR